MVTRRRLIGQGAVVAAAALALDGCTDDSPQTPDPTSSAPTSSAPRSATPSSALGSPRITETVARGLDVPWGIAFLSGGDALVSLRDTARIVRIGGSAGRRTVRSLGRVPGVAPGGSGGGEGGLLGIAVAPDDDSVIYAYLTTDRDNRVVRISHRAGRLGSVTPILTGLPTAVHHHGGRLLFDPRDGHLFVSVGDAQQPALAQDRSSPAGKILRITTSGRPAPGNPFGNAVWSYGHRNVEGLAFDAGHRLWATEFGDKRADELNLIVKGGNYGWPLVEGNTPRAGLVAPRATWGTQEASPAGIAIAGQVAWIGALKGQRLWATRLTGTSAGTPRSFWQGTYGRLRTVVVAPDGRLWVTTSNTDGRTSPRAGDDRILAFSG